MGEVGGAGGVGVGGWEELDVAVYVAEKWVPSHADTVFAFRWRNPGGAVTLQALNPGP